MTNGKVEMISIFPDSSDLYPYKWGTPEAYLERKEEFLLLTQDEVAERKAKGFDVDATKIVYKDNDFVVLLAG